MTSRSRYDKIWAQDGTSTDPNLDTTNPLYIANRYENVGWKAEKPPEHWQNFLQQVSDLKVLEALVNGILMTDPDVNYSSGAITSSGGKLFVNSATGSQEILDVSASGYNSKIDSLSGVFNAHNTVGNKHNDDIKTTIIGGGYYKSEVDAMFGSATDPKTIVFHKNQTGKNVHGETVGQLGTLSAVLGGTFTGPVTFGKDVILQVAPNKAMHLDSALGYVGFVSGNYFLAVDGAGNVWYGSPSGVYLCATVNNYTTLEIRTNYSFALPPPVISMNLEADINDVMSSGSWTITTSSDPAFTLGKGMAIQSSSLSGFYVSTDATMHFVGWNESTGTKLSTVVDIPVGKNYTTLAQILADAGAGAATYIKCVYVYPRLSLLQKSSLAR